MTGKFRGKNENGIRQGTCANYLLVKLNVQGNMGSSSKSKKHSEIIELTRKYDHLQKKTYGQRHTRKWQKNNK